MILTAIDVSGWLWAGKDVSNSLLYAMRVSLGALQMPFYLGFIVASCYSDFKLRKLDILHAIPFLFFLYLTLPGNQLQLAANNQEMELFYISASESVFEFVISNLQYYVYIAIAVFILLQFRAIFQKHYSDSRSSVFSWLLQLVVVSILAHTLSFVRGLISFTSISEAYIYLQIFGALVVLAVITWITLKALLEPDIFRGIDRTLLAASKRVKGEPNRHVSQDREEAKLLRYMEEEQPYLNAELTLLDLSQQLAMTQRDLSELINQKLAVHFFDFINSYRIERAKERLIEDRALTVLEILYSVGFNSKSSFNTAFKKHAQSTPTAYRKANSLVNEKSA